MGLFLWRHNLDIWFGQVQIRYLLSHLLFFLRILGWPMYSQESHLSPAARAERTTNATTSKKGRKKISYNYLDN